VIKLEEGAEEERERDRVPRRGKDTAEEGGREEKRTFSTPVSPSSSLQEHHSHLPLAAAAAAAAVADEKARQKSGKRDAVDDLPLLLLLPFLPKM